MKRLIVSMALLQETVAVPALAAGAFKGSPERSRKLSKGLVGLSHGDAAETLSGGDSRAVPSGIVG
jgi:hypothetical protein